MAALLGAVARTGPVALPAGTMVGGQYRIERSLGEGGMGVVYLARDTRLDRDVAVKLGSVVSQAALGTIEREAMALAKLSHPNVVVVFQVGEIDGRVFIAMEHVDGGTARAWLTAAPRSTRDILALYGSAGEGLAAAHAAGLIHRDFKPDNVLVGVDGRPRVADFGLARAADPATPSVSPGPADDMTLSTQTGRVVGTPAYMPPEQLAGGELDPRADQFAFAAALWEALFGARPFDGKTPADVLAAIESQPPASNAEASKGRRVPRHVLAALRRALSPSRDDRWPDMTSLLVELRRDPLAQRRRASAAGLAVGAVAASVVIVLVLSRGDDAPSPCQSAGDTSRSTWTTAKQLATRDALLASASPGAREVADRLTATLDQQVARIAAGRVAACEATHVRRTQSADLLDRRGHCLDRREDEIAALIAVVEHLAPDQPADAVLPAARALSSPADCDDVERLAALATPPSDPATRAERAAIEALLALSVVRHRAGLEGPAIEAAKEAMAKADALRDAALGAEARLQVGLLQAVKDGPGGIELLDAAARQAAEARDDVLAARIAVGMMQITINPMRQLDEAERLRPLADSAVIRAGDRPRERASYLATLARLRGEQGEHAAARAALERSLELEVQMFGENDPRLAHALNYLSVVLTNQGEHDAALDVRRRSERLLVDAYGPAHPHVGVVVTNLGSSHFHLGRYEEALAAYQRSLGIKERASGADHPSLIPNLVNIATTQLKLAPAEAMPPLERARAIAEKVYGVKHPAYARVLSVLADARHALGDPASAITLLVDVLAIQEESGPERPELAETLLGLGAARLATGDHEGARADLQRARRIALATVGAGSPLMAQALGALADLEAAQGRPAQARRLMEQAVAILELAHGAEHPEVQAMRGALGKMPTGR